MYYSTIRSILSATNIKKLHIAQNFTYKIIGNVRKYGHVTPALRQFECLPVDDLEIYVESNLDQRHLIYAIGLLNALSCIIAPLETRNVTNSAFWEKSLR